MIILFYRNIDCFCWFLLILGNASLIKSILFLFWRIIHFLLWLFLISNNNIFLADILYDFYLFFYVFYVLRIYSFSDLLIEYPVNCQIGFISNYYIRFFIHDLLRLILAFVYLRLNNWILLTDVLFPLQRLMNVVSVFFILIHLYGN